MTGKAATSDKMRAAKMLAAPAGQKDDFYSDVLMGALPHPILVVGPDRAIRFANAAAEAFFSTSAAMLKRSVIQDVVGFGCPLLALVEQIQNTSVTVNEYGIEISSPRLTHPRLIDVYGGPMPDDPTTMFLMLQQRSMAQMIERQLTHRAAARSAR